MNRAFARAFAGLTFLALAVPAWGQGLHIGPTTPDPRTIPNPTNEPIWPGRRPVRPIRTPQLYIKSLSIKAHIDNGIATTTLRQVFHNPGRRIAEGTWILPLPTGATADNFTMTMNGKQVSGEVLDATRARSVYESIVRRRRDPGLLEYMGNGCLRARVFPIPAKSDMVVEVRYRQVLPETAGVHHWNFPLRAANVSGRSARRISLDLTIKSQKAIKNVFSPTENVHFVRKGDHLARASFEMSGGQMARRDIDIFYGLSDKEFGLSLLTHRKKSKAGYFVMMLAPKMRWDESKAMPKSIQFVVDTSGSMNGKKIQQARAALRFFINSLKSRDYFNVIPFSTDARPFFSTPKRASRENVDQALKLVAEIEARGGTNIEKALTTALSADVPDVKNLVSMTVFLTDGLPTVDTTDPKTLLSIVGKSNTHKHRVFVFGVGHDVNTKLLDKIAAQSHGARDYVKEDESIELKTGALFTKLSHPVMSNVRIDCDGIDGFDVFPKVTPDLFKGSRLMLTGRYKGRGNHAIRLTGIVEGKEKTFVYEGTFPEKSESHDFIPTLWAQRKVAVLLDAIRLNGRSQELIQEIRRLGAEHGIVTPYTSHLILEEGTKLAQARFGRGFDPRNGVGGFGAGAAAPGARDRLRRELVRAGELDEEEADQRVGKLAKDVKTSKKEAEKSLDNFAQYNGKAAVRRSRALMLMAESKSVSGGRGRGATRLVTRHVKGHTFHMIGGVWIDGAFRAAMKDGVTEVKAFSDEYFALIRRHPELAKIFAFSSRILVVINGTAIEIT
jgi:Ca-activated chloride channel family protein